MKTRNLFITTTALLALLAPLSFAQEKPDQLRTQAAKLSKDGNYKESLEVYKKLLDADGDTNTGKDLSSAYTCLEKLKRITEADELIEIAWKCLDLTQASLQ